MKRQNYPLRDGTLSALHFGNMSEPVRLVFLHANGFNAQSYRTLLERLGVHVVAFDMRGHGQSGEMLQPSNIPNWHIFRDDCVEFFERHLPELTDGRVVLAGHSLGLCRVLLRLLSPRVLGINIPPLCVLLPSLPRCVPSTSTCM